MIPNSTPLKPALLASLFTFLALSLHAQVVSIPDPNFKTALVENPDINTNGDDEIQTSEAEAYTGQINVAGKDINFLNGIEAFINVSDLRVHYNNLTQLDVSANTALEKLHIQHNQISEINLDVNSELEMLRAQNNDLTQLVLTANTKLRYLEAQNNQLTKLNIKNGNNTSIYAFNASGNPGLGCVQVDDAAYAEANWNDDVDGGTNFSTDCDYPTGEVVEIPDQNFKDALLANGDINTNGDDEIQVSEAEAVHELDVSDKSISDLTGIEAFASLMTLNCDNNNLVSLNLSENTSLVELYCSNNNLTSISFHENLDVLIASNNSLNSFDISATPVNYLDVSNNQLTSLNLKTGTVIEYMFATENPDLNCVQAEDDLREAAVDWEVDPGVTFSEDCLYGEPVVHIPDQNFKEALLADEYINLNGDNEIQLSEAEQADGVYVSDLNITDMTGIEAFTGLRFLFCNNNSIPSLDISGTTELLELHCFNNQITELQLGNLPDVLRAQNNQIQSLSLEGYATEVNLNDNNLTFLRIFLEDSPVSGWTATNNPDLYCVEVESVEYAEDNWRYAVDEQVEFSTDCPDNEPVVHIPDQNFKDALLADEDINTNGDDEIQVSETEGVTEIDASGAGVSDPTGIRAFEQLLQLNFNNNNLSSLDVSWIGLDYLGVSNNQLNSLTLGNAIEYLDAENNPDLTCIQTNGANYYATNSSWGSVDEGVVFSLNCYYDDDIVHIPDPNFKEALVQAFDSNADGEIQTPGETQYAFTINVSGLGISDLTGIEAFGWAESLDCSNNNLTSLDISNLSSLSGVECFNNQIHTIEFNSYLSHLYIANNNLTSLTLPGEDGTGDFIELDISNNDLTSLDISASEYTLTLDATDNPSLSCVEVEDPERAADSPVIEVDPGVTFSTDCPDSEAIVHIPDQNFKDALLADEDINTNGDDEIQVSEAEVYSGQINVAGKGIADLTGIEAFTMLTDLRVHYNNLTTFDISANTALKKLHFQNNQVTNLDLSANTELDMIRAQNNDLMKLDLSANSKLRYLEVQNNNLTELNIQSGNNTSMYSFNATGNPALGCIQVDDVAYAEANWSENIDGSASFSTDCGYSSGEVVYIPDQNIKDALLADEDINTNGDDEIQVSETEGVLDIDVSGNGIGDLTGVEAFNELLRLTAHNNNLTALDITTLGLDYLGVNDNQLTSLKFTGIIEYLDAVNNDLTCIETTNPDYYYEGDPNVSVDEGVVFSTDCSSAEPVVYIPDENFKSVLLASGINSNGDDEIQYSEAQGVPDIYVSGQSISDLTGIEAFTDLEFLDCSDNDLSSLDLSSNPDLEILDCSDNDITHLDLQANTVLNELYASNNSLVELLLPASVLQYIYADQNNLTSLDVDMVLGLEILALWDNEFETLDVSSTGALLGLYVSNNNLTTLNVQNGNNINMYDFSATGNPLGCVQVDDVSDAEAYWSDNVDPGAYFSLDCSGGGPAIVHIPDANFKDALLANEDINTNGDDEIQVAEAETFSGQINVTGQGIEDLTGIEAFVMLTDLRVHYNNLTNLPLSANTALEKLHFQYNQVSSLDLSANTQLEMIRAQNNELEYLDLSANNKLRYLEVQYNMLTGLNIRNGNNTAMYSFNAVGNPGLGCIEVDDIAYAEANWSGSVDAGASFSTDCSGTMARSGPEDQEQLVADGEMPNELIIYPVPTHEELTVRAGMLSENTELLLFDNQGREFYRELMPSEGALNVTLNLGQMNLSSGVYYLRLVSDEGTITKKFIKK